MKDKEKINWNELVEKARSVINNSYAPYSGYNVAAAVLGESGKIYTGVNVENSSYGLTICAERSAIFTAVSSGERNFRAIAVVSTGKTKPSPCGACLQVISEFSTDIPICCATLEDNTQYISSLKELFPSPFRLK